MHAFRDNAATLLLATGSASRGLDLPGVTHIVNLGVPSSAVEYLHRAGRVGRLGSLSPGAVMLVLISVPDSSTGWWLRGSCTLNAFA